MRNSDLILMFESLLLLWTILIDLNSIYDFLNVAKQQCEVLEGMAKKTSSLYLEIAKYFAFDAKKYTMEEFFGDIKAFIAGFNVSLHALYSYVKNSLICYRCAFSFVGNNFHIGHNVLHFV